MSDITALPPPTLFLTDADVAAIADWRSTVAALSDAYAMPVSAAMVPPRSMARSALCVGAPPRAELLRFEMPPYDGKCVCILKRLEK